MIKRLEHTRILMYSHDTFGLGHLRRCRTIAHAIVERYKGVNVIIISGSQIAGAFDFRARVDFVKIPSVIKLYNGEYSAIGEYIDVEDILEMRKLIIQKTAEAFRPDIFIADKEPLGLKGELEPTLQMLGERGRTQRVLGLRDVMDDADLLAAEWEERDVLNKIDDYYDRIWVYGPKQFWNPLQGLNLPDGLEDRLFYTGFLEREVPSSHASDSNYLPDNYILVTAGGGGDGSALMDQVLSAREHDRANDYPIAMVLGPFMKSESRERIRHRASHLSNVTVIDFEQRMEVLLQKAVGVVGMCGYNTFCEVLSFNKKALFVPRTHPRKEQYIRARKASDLGLCQMLTPEEAATPNLLAEALRKLPNQIVPSRSLFPGDLDGLDAICRDVEAMASADTSSNSARTAPKVAAGE